MKQQVQVFRWLTTIYGRRGTLGKENNESPYVIHRKLITFRMVRPHLGGRKK
jgi:hypothetical protein